MVSIPWAWVASGAHLHNEVPKTFEWGFILPYNQRGCKLWSGVNLLVCATTGNGTSNPSEPIFCISWVCWGYRTGHAHAPQERWARSEARGWILSSLRWRPSDFWVVHVFPRIQIWILIAFGEAFRLFKPSPQKCLSLLRIFRMCQNWAPKALTDNTLDKHG